MGALSIDELKELRSEVVGVIADNPDAILSDPALDYSTVLELVRTTGRTDLFRVALDKVRQIEDTTIQLAAWIEVLDAIEIEISLGSAVEDEQVQATSDLPQDNKPEQQSYDENHDQHQQ